MKLIDPNDLYMVAEKNHGRFHVADVDVAKRYDVEPIVHAAWIEYTLNSKRGKVYKCNRCGKYRGVCKTPYCSSCGARMDGEENEAD